LLLERLAQGEPQAPTLREVRDADGGRCAVLDLPVAVEVVPLTPWDQVERVLGVDWGVHTLLTATALNVHGSQVGRPFFLDTGGFDGRQARTRRQIDRLKARIERLEAELLTLPEASMKAAWVATRQLSLRRELARCWQKYARRNRALAHLASNVLLVLAQVHGCTLLAVESLTTLKTTGRGKGVKGRWRHYRNNTQLRGEIWRMARYKCRLVGLRFRTVASRDTSHTCPRCGQAAQTFRAPDRREEMVSWGRWLRCATCGYSADRDYAASVNIARLGAALLATLQISGPGKVLILSQLKPASYTGADSALRLPPTGPRPARNSRGTICYYPGWLGSAYLQSAQPKTVFPRLRSERLRA
jgi:predicted Zn-ribbon and HTH transcriptional regulator